MDITKIDRNFSAVTVTGDGKKRYRLPCLPFALYGGMYDENVGFVRMDQNVAARVSETVDLLSKNGAGLRLNFTTDSSSIKLLVKESNFCRFPHMPITGSASFVLCKRENGKKYHCATLFPAYNAPNEFEVSAWLDGKMHDYILYFPLYSSVAALSVELDADAYLGEGKGYSDEKPVLYYGSSITQGGCASRADNSYQDMIGERTNVDYINLGFSGGGMAEDVMVDYLATVDCSVFVCDYDHNAPDAEYLSKTHERLYLRYREKRPNTPIVFVTRPDRQGTDIDERADIIYSTYENAKKNGDEKVYFVDGRTFFPEDVRERCLVDGLHPTDLGFYYMAQKIGDIVQAILKKAQE